MSIIKKRTDFKEMGRIKYSEEFKGMILELYGSGKSPTEIVREYGLSSSLLYKWINGNKTVTVDDEKITVNEIKKLKRELAEVKEERDILKKVITIFAKK